MQPGAELLIDPPFISRAAAWLAALAGANPQAKITKAYRGRHKLLVLYGVGNPFRALAAAQHVKAGGRVAMWDLGYWTRAESMRLSIDRNHPTAEQLASCDLKTPRPRPRLSQPRAFDPSGPILLCGMGPKSCTHLGLVAQQWEHAKVRDLQARFPGRPIIFRPKPGNPFDRIEGTRRSAIGPIEDALQGISLVVCRHSNVAIDACIAGVPVECEDGAAFALYRDDQNPGEDARREFLARLAWWNWGSHEAAEAWRFMEEMTCD
jgi:hypothetical protein